MDIVVAGAPFAYQQAGDDIAWLNSDQVERLERIDPSNRVIHTGRRQLRALLDENAIEPAVLFTETRGTVDSYDGVPSMLETDLFSRMVQAPTMRWIQLCSSGVDHVRDLVPRSLTVTNASGVHAQAIAESAMAGILFHERRLADRLEHQRLRRYVQVDCRELSGSQMTILGTGAIGSAIAHRATAFGINIVGVSASGRRVEGFDTVYTSDRLVDLAADTDILVVACPLTSATRHLVGADVLAALPTHACVVNVSRGEVIDEGALHQALRTGQVGHAYLDVFSAEPLPADDPAWTLPNTLITPHDGHSSNRIGLNQFELFVTNLERFVAGQPLDNVVDFDRGY